MDVALSAERQGVEEARDLARQIAPGGTARQHVRAAGPPGPSRPGPMELEAGDCGLRTFVSVLGSLAMSAIATWGSEEQKQQWLPGMARGEAIGCFGLTEPTAGSDPSSMSTFARREGEDWVLDGAERWIGLASIADVAVIGAMTDDGVRGFLVPTSTPGFTATPIEPKPSMRASIQCDIALEHSPLRHANNLESVRTCEGTDEVHTLLLGQQLAGHPAFR